MAKDSFVKLCHILKNLNITTRTTLNVFKLKYGPNFFMDEKVGPWRNLKGIVQSANMWFIRRRMSIMLREKKQTLKSTNTQRRVVVKTIKNSHLLLLGHAP